MSRQSTIINRNINNLNVRRENKYQKKGKIAGGQRPAEGRQFVLTLAEGPLHRLVWQASLANLRRPLAAGYFSLFELYSRKSARSIHLPANAATLYNAPMPYRCLADFLEDLNHAGELNRIDDEVDPAEQLAKIVADTARSGGPALLFGAVQGCNLPVLCNLLATEGRICRALGIASIDELAERIAGLLGDSAPAGWFERLKGAARPAALGGLAPREVKSAACQQIVRLGGDVHLAELPWIGSAAGTYAAGFSRHSERSEESRHRREDEILRCAQNDKIAYPPENPAAHGGIISGTAVFSAEPDSHRTVCGRFDLERLDDSRLAIHWATHDSHARLRAEYRARNQKMPLAVVVGGDPTFLLAAAAPLPTDADLCAVAGLLRGKPLDVVACRSVDLFVPAESEIVLEGFLVEEENENVDAAHSVVMQVAALTHRANPIFAMTVPVGSSSETCTMHRAMQRAFLPLTRLAMPDMVDYDMPEFAAARGWAVVAIRKTYAAEGRRAAHAAWGLRPMMFAKMLVVVDADVDVRNQDAVLSAIAANMNPGRDVIFERGPVDPFDAASSGQKMAIDATRKLPGEVE